VTEAFGSGFVRDANGRLVLAPPGAKEGWVSGFVRDEYGRLVVSGAEGSEIGTAVRTKTVAASGEAVTINLSEGSFWKITLTKNTTLTFPSPQSGVSSSFELELIQDGTGNRTVTWPASVRWSGGVAPTLSTAKEAIDTVAFVSDGEHWLGYFGQKGSAIGGSEPEAGRYISAMQMGLQFGANVEPGIYALLPTGTGSNLLTGNVAQGIRTLDPTKYAVTGRTPSYRLQIQAAVNLKAPVSNFTVELRKVLETGGASGTISVTSHEATGISATVTAPALKAITAIAESADVTAPAAGPYILICTSSAKTAAESSTGITATLLAH
jgi:hypothetical protein